MRTIATALAGPDHDRGELIGDVVAGVWLTLLVLGLLHLPGLV